MDRCLSGSAPVFSASQDDRNLMNDVEPLNVFHVAPPEAGGCMPIVENMWLSIAISEAHVNDTCLASNSTHMQPIAHISTRVPYWPHANNTSGALYHRVVTSCVNGAKFAASGQPPVVAAASGQHRKLNSRWVHPTRVTTITDFASQHTPMILDKNIPWF